MRILFISSTRIGDAVITSGLLDHLIHTYPKCRVTIVCGRVSAGVFARMPNLERIVLIEKRRYDLHWLTLWRDVVGTIWDMVIDLRGSALAYLVPARRRVVKRSLPGRKYEQFAALLSIDPAPLPVVWTAAEDRARARVLLPEGGPVIGLAPTANWPPKAWPAERFAALFHRLAEGRLSGARAAIFGGPGEQERAMAQPLLDALPGAIDLCGRLTLPETAACIQRCTVYVGNDSGLMHLAAAAGTPTIGLCGTTIDRAEEMAPAGRFAAWALASGPTMADLSVETALAATLHMLDEAERKARSREPGTGSRGPVISAS
jgi:heptosyltransferase III